MKFYAFNIFGVCCGCVAISIAAYIFSSEPWYGKLIEKLIENRSGSEPYHSAKNVCQRQHIRIKYILFAFSKLSIYKFIMFNNFSRKAFIKWIRQAWFHRFRFGGCSSNTRFYIVCWHIYNDHFHCWFSQGFPRWFVFLIWFRDLSPY